MVSKESLRSSRMRTFGIGGKNDLVKLCHTVNVFCDLAVIGDTSCFYMFSQGTQGGFIESF